MGLLDWVSGLLATSSAPHRDEAIADAIIERAIDATDKRLRFVSRYRKTLHQSALTTFDHIQRTLEVIPGPITVSESAWAEDRALRTFFARAADLPLPFSRSRDVRALFRDPMAADECVALLAFEQGEREVVAIRPGADGVQREAVYTAISFDRPVVLAPRANLEAAQVELGNRMVDYLAMKAMALVSTHQQERKELEEERALLKMRLQMAHASGRGLGGMGGGNGNATVAGADVAALSRELDCNEQALASTATTGVLTQLLDHLNEVLGSPGTWLQVETPSLALDEMNFKVAENGEAVVTLDLCTVQLVDRPRYAVMMARFPRSALLPEQDLWRAAEQL